jgi:hypothetical protein
MIAFPIFGSENTFDFRFLKWFLGWKNSDPAEFAYHAHWNYTFRRRRTG